MFTINYKKKTNQYRQYHDVCISVVKQCKYSFCFYKLIILYKPNYSQKENRGMAAFYITSFN